MNSQLAVRFLLYDILTHPITDFLINLLDSLLDVAVDEIHYFLLLGGVNLIRDLLLIFDLLV